MDLNKHHRNKYDTFIISLYASGKEYLLPEKFRYLVPYSTASSWRNLIMDAYMGHESRSIQYESLQLYEILEEHKNLKRTVKLLFKVWLTIASFLKPILKKSDNEIFITQLQKLSNVLPRKMVLRLTGISASSFYYRVHKLKIKCSLSPVSLCLKRHPLQLAVKEVNTMKALFSDIRFTCWPIASIAHYARRNELLYASLSTLYKYSALLGFKRRFPKPDEKTKGIVSTAPNQFLHVDTTFYTLQEGIKSAITLVSDNFSRKILGWSISEKHGAENVKAALDMAIQTIQLYHPKHVVVTLVADGGSENHALSIEELIASTPLPGITKVIALKDIAFSNSPIEAINKIMKRYIRHKLPQTFNELLACIIRSIEDYNIYRPHYAINGLTPMEAYTQKIPDMEFSEQIRQAKAIRLEQNRKSTCQKC
ncbi:DDE-type integrase/transposase/recombinase [Sporocytophaga myxococcoides]|uniref:DDE-type integrase/transposase/recombinase n=1 Tax=Sporocytophaga myxococcoides TaxID=153721 RepID=UPI00138B1A7E|nr:DDE-type integrase/transposase/recombinase [Sporocytophaga myxococcoides]